MNIIFTLVVTFFVFQLGFGQTEIEVGEEFKLAPATEKKVSSLVENLSGTWLLAKTVSYENGDTTIHAPSIQLWETPGAKPWTKMVLDSLRNFEIDQTCQKCPYLNWTGHYEIEIRTINEIRFFYLYFIDRRVEALPSKKRKTTFVLDFNGFLSGFENGKMTITDKDGREWIYDSLKKESK